MDTDCSETTAHCMLQDWDIAAYLDSEQQERAWPDAQQQRPVRQQHVTEALQAARKRTAGAIGAPKVSSAGTIVVGVLLEPCDQVPVEAFTATCRLGLTRSSSSLTRSSTWPRRCRLHTDTLLVSLEVFKVSSCTRQQILLQGCQCAVAASAGFLACQLRSSSSQKSQTTMKPAGWCRCLTCDGTTWEAWTRSSTPSWRRWSCR